MPLKDEDIKFLHITTRPIINPAGDTERVMNLHFMVRGFGPFSIDVPLDEFSEEEAREKVTRRAEQIVKVLENPILLTEPTEPTKSEPSEK